jgi:ribosomal-protein-alanine N-acetyltransferase
LTQPDEGALIHVAAGGVTPVTLDLVIPEGYGVEELGAGHAPALAAAYTRNRAHLEPWEPAHDDGFFTVRGQEASVAGHLAAARAGLVAGWVLTHGDDVVGRINLNNIVMGVLRSASVGYWVDQDHLGRGLATAAVQHAATQARERGLHRLEGGTLLHNVASQRVLLGCGFELYGIAPKFLFIAGAWQDHRLYQRILHDQPL